MRRRLIIAAIIFAALVVPAVILLFVVDRSPALQNAINGFNNSNTNTTTNSSANTNTEAVDPETNDITYVARNFAEVYGNESTENNFANLVDAQAWGTQSFNDFLNRTIALNRSAPPAETYRGITTKAIVIDITNKTLLTASVSVGTQRVETIDQAETDFYQKIFLDLVKVADDWKVNAAAWEPR